MTPDRRAVLGWIALALAGLAIAVGVTYAATQLVGQHVALSGEPRVGDEELVPPPRTVPRGTTTTTPTTTGERQREGTEPESAEHEREPDGDDD